MSHSREVTTRIALFPTTRNTILRLCAHIRLTLLVTKRAHASPLPWHPTITVTRHQAIFCLIRPYNRGTLRAPRVGSSYTGCAFATRASHNPTLRWYHTALLHAYIIYIGNTSLNFLSTPSSLAASATKVMIS